jgi:hypothetical protein
VAAFVLAIAVVDAAWALARPPRMRRLARAARGPLLVAVTTVAVIALCAWPTLRRYAGADLAAQFAGYRYGGDFAMRLAWIPSRLGLLTVIVGLGGLAWGLSRPGARRVCAALLAGALFAALVGARIQVLGLQHFCWFAPAAAVGFTLAARALGRRARLLGAGVAALALLPVLYAVAPVPRSAAGDRWLGRLRGWPEVRADYDSLRRLGTDVLVRLGAKGSVYVACSSSTFNSDLLRSVLDAAEPGAARRVLPTADVDFRDGAPAALFRARMVLVCEPVQYHLPPASQSVVTLAAEPFLAGSGVARHYRRLRAGWTLDHGVRVHAFVPGERVPEDERWEFLARFPPVG